MLLVRGNSKIGKNIWQFSIPAGKTCPGKSFLCNDRCYAQKGMFQFSNVKESLERRLEASKRDDFVSQIIKEIIRKNINVVRIHVAGDYYSAAYVKKWHEIVKACANTIFFTYTRSWRIPDINKELRRLAKCKNCRMWYSADMETGYPKIIPKNIRIAYMSVNTTDIPAQKCKIVFRDYGIRDKPQKKINFVQVCPPENGVNTDFTCEKCKICWRDETSKLLSLPMVTT